MSIACPSLIGNHYPELCAAVDHYCERTSSALDAEPINALTNAAFLIAAWGAWRLQFSYCIGNARGLITALIGTMVLVGFGSFLFHTVATRWAEWGDVLPIMLFMLFYLWLVLTWFFRSPARVKLLVLGAYFAATFYAEAAVPNIVLWGGALYVPTLFLMLVIGLALHRRRHPAAVAFLAATAVFLVAFSARTLDARLCSVFPVGTHFIWHLLNAALLFILIRAAIVHAAPPDGARGNQPPIR